MRTQTTEAINEEISLTDIAEVFRRNRRLFAISGLVGLVLSLAYTLMATKTFEAKFQIQMAQYVVINTSSGFNVVSIEEPALLIQRLKFPTTYPDDVLKACGVNSNEGLAEFLNGTLDVQLVKNVVSTLEFKVHSPSTNQSKQCAEGLVKMIQIQQYDLIEELFAGRQAMEVQYQQTLREEQQQLATIKSAELTNTAYLAKLDKLSWLRTRIDALHEESELSKKHASKLVAPISVLKNPLSPKAGLVIPLGIMLGLILGTILGLGRTLLSRK